MKTINSNKIKSTACILLCASVLAACGGTSAEIDKDINDAEKNNSSVFTLVNATDDMVNFYAKYIGISESIYQSEYEVASVINDESSTQIIYQWNDALSRTSIAITDTNTQTLRATDEYNLINNQAYIGIAWLDEGEYVINLVEANNNTTESDYTVRFFTSTDQTLHFDGSNLPEIIAEKAQITSSFSFDNCADMELINNISANFCQIANVGNSYIAVIKANGDVIFTQE